MKKIITYIFCISFTISLAFYFSWIILNPKLSFIDSQDVLREPFFLIGLSAIFLLISISLLIVLILMQAGFFQNFLKK